LDKTKDYNKQSLKTLQAAKEDIKTIRRFNRVVTVNEVNKCHSRSRMLGMCWGLYLSAIVNTVFLRNVWFVRKAF